MQRVIRIVSNNTYMNVFNPVTKKQLASRQLRIDTYHYLTLKFGAGIKYLVSTEPLRANGRALRIFKIVPVRGGSESVDLESTSHSEGFRFCKKGFKSMMRTTEGKIYIYKVNEQ